MKLCSKVFILQDSVDSVKYNSRYALSGCSLSPFGIDLNVT